MTVNQAKNEAIEALSTSEEYDVITKKAKHCLKTIKSLRRKFNVITNDKGDNVVRNHNNHMIGYLSSGAVVYLDKIKKKNINFFLQGGSFSFSYFDLFSGELFTIVPDSFNNIQFSKEDKDDIHSALILKFLEKNVF